MRYTVMVATVLAGAAVVLLTAERGQPAGADKNTEANLKKEVSQLQQQVKQLQTANTQGQTTLNNLQSVLNGYRGAGLIHIVILKLKMEPTKPTSPTTSTSPAAKPKDGKVSPKDEPQKLMDDAYAQLAKISTVRGLWAGKPSTNGTPDANGDYTVALVLAFDDANGLKTYLSDPAHTKFADRHLDNFQTPIIFDIEPQSKSHP